MKKTIIFITALSILALVTVSPVLACPSEGFQKLDGDIYDSYGICRTRGYDNDGFFQYSEDGFDPIITRESLGENADLAWETGLSFIERYPEQSQRAREIFSFVRDKVKYTPDKTAFRHDEFAQNADELARIIEEKGRAAGDCEDMAILLSILYKAAGFRPAIVLVPEHAATLVYFPDYTKASRTFTVNGEKGWIWAEATGSTNELGWVPSRIGKPMMAREIYEGPIDLGAEPRDLSDAAQVHVTGTFQAGNILIFFSIVFILWILSGISRGTSRRRSFERKRRR
ncbi:transglutaminase domain-containing protein [Chloroflexota bacterium]